MNKQTRTNQIRTVTWVTLLIVVLAVVAVAYVLLQKRNTDTAAVQYQTVRVAKGALTASIGATGTVRSNQVTILSWKTSGTIGNVNVQAGDEVKTGDVLASLLPDANQSSMQASLVTAQENLAQLTSPVAVANARLAVTTAQKNVVDTQTALNNTQYWQNESMIQDYYAKYVIAKDNLDKAQTAYDNAKVGQYINNKNEAIAYQTLYNAKQAYNNANYYYSLYSQAPTQRQMDEAQANLDLANATLKEAQIYLSVLTGGTAPSDATGASLARLDQARMAVQNAQKNLDMFKITAPFSGMITEVFGMAGDQVAPTISAFRVDDMSQLKVDVQVSEVDINNIQVGQPVSLTFDAIAGKTYNGKVAEVAQVGNSIQGAADFTITVELTDPDAHVKPGMTAAVSIIAKQLSNVLLVPNRAVRLVNHQRVVYVLQNGQPQMVTISLGITSDTQSEVASGDLKAGDVIILNPLSNLFTRPANGDGGAAGGG
jgi:HlyD family secretion protein